MNADCSGCDSRLGRGAEAIPSDRRLKSQARSGRRRAREVGRARVRVWGRGFGGVFGWGVWNEAIWGFGLLVMRGCGCRLGVWGGFSGLETLQFVEGIAVVAVGGVDAALEAGEIVGVVVEGLADLDFVVGPEGVEGALLPELGLADAKTAEEPFGVDEGVDEHALLGGGGVEAAVVFRLEGFEVGGFFAADDLGFGVDAGFEGIHAGGRFALGSVGAGGFLCVEAIGLDLFLGCHTTGG